MEQIRQQYLKKQEQIHKEKHSKIRQMDQLSTELTSQILKAQTKL